MYQIFIPQPTSIYLQFKTKFRHILRLGPLQSKGKRKKEKRKKNKKQKQKKTMHMIALSLFSMY